MSSEAQNKFEALLSSAVHEQTLVKLTLGKYRGAEPGLINVFARPVVLRGTPHLTFVYRYATRDVTKNHLPEAGLQVIRGLIGPAFRDAHLFTPAQTAQLTLNDDGDARLKVKVASAAPVVPNASHDRAKSHLIPSDAPWLQALGVTNSRGQPREAMASKLRQINKYVELLQHLVQNSDLSGRTTPFRLYDMGSGKGYLTFAAAQHFGALAMIKGIETRVDLVDHCNKVAADSGFGERLKFVAGNIHEAALGDVDVLVALHACDTATDDALFRGIEKSASLIVVSPCCQKELRNQLTPPPVLAPVLHHGIFQERQSEFVTDALRSLLLEWAGYRTKVFEFISTEHTAKNVMIAATRTGIGHSPKTAEAIAAFCRFYGIRHQRLAQLLGVSW